MAKSGIGFVNAMAYGTERTKALAHQHGRTGDEAKELQSDPTKIDNKPEAHHHQ
jgi:hypothetical protein